MLAVFLTGFAADVRAGFFADCFVDCFVDFFVGFFADVLAVCRVRLLDVVVRPLRFVPVEARRCRSLTIGVEWRRERDEVRLVTAAPPTRP